MSEDSTLTTSDQPATMPSSLVLVLSSAQAPIRSESLPARGVISVGRSSECGIVIDDPSLSRRHATLRLPELAVVDHGSRNGTWIGETRVEPEVETTVALGRPFRLGHVTAVVVRVGSVDRGVLRQLDAQLEQARGQRACVVRAVTPPAWAARARVLAHTDELWLGLVVGEVDDAHDIGVARYPDDGETASELYLAAERDRAQKRRQAPSAIDGVYALAERIAQSSASVLIYGETGVGKEVLAELLHRRSPRAQRPIVKVNCAAITPSLFESQMFGHEKGAFTGAVELQRGLIEAADTGTLFLDEVAELPLELQAKLLRVIEDRVVTRVGAVQGQKIDVRFIAASNEQLRQCVDAGTFRADLYYRLAGVTLELPPLRARVEEIAPLAELFAMRAAERTHGGDTPAFSAAAIERLRGYAWPGNIRQLRNVVERAVMLCEGPVIEPAQLVFDEAPRRAPAELVVDRPLDANVPEDLLAALSQCAGNQTRAARMLGISRNTLLARLDQFDLPRPRKKG